MKIKTIDEFERYIFDNFNASISNVNEVNTFECYRLDGDNEHDYSSLKRVFKIKGEFHPLNECEEVFILLFSKDGSGICEAKVLGMQTKKLENIWRLVEWQK